EAAKVADGEETRLDAPPAEIDDGGNADAGQHARDRARHVPALDRLERVEAHPVDGARGPLDFGRFLIVGLDDANALERLGDDGGEVSRAFHIELRGLAGAPPELADDEGDEGNDGGADQG